MIPHDLKVLDTAGIWITGGKNTDGVPDGVSEDIIVAEALAMSIGMVTVSLF